MGKRNTDLLPEEVELLRTEVQEWRCRKASPGAPMPKAIWEAAIRLAHRFGVCRIARATGLSYVWLRKKLERSAKSASGAPQEMAPAFLEVPVELLMTEAWKDEGNADRFGPARTLTVVEVSAPDGSRMRIQVGAGSLDAPGIIAAFLGRPH